MQCVRRLIQQEERVMVSLDSDHSNAHVLKELRAYAGIVTIGNYLVVEDTNLNGHPVWPKFGPGPREALEEFLRESSGFLRDESREKFHLTLNAGGYLKKVSAFEGLGSLMNHVRLLCKAGAGYSPVLHTYFWPVDDIERPVAL